MIIAFVSGIPFALVGKFFRPKYKKAKKIHQLMLDTKTTPIGSLKLGLVEVRGRVSSSMLSNKSLGSEALRVLSF